MKFLTFGNSLENVSFWMTEQKQEAPDFPFDATFGDVALALYFMTSSMSSAYRYEEPRSRWDWNNPCSTTPHGRQSGVGDITFHGVGQPDSDAEIERHQTQLVLEMEQAIMSARRLEDFITKRRLLSNSHLLGECRSIPSLLGMPQRETSHLSTEDSVSTLPYDFRRMATLSVFLEEISLDSHFRGYFMRLNSLMTHMRKSMCLMEVIALARSQTIHRDIADDTMPAIYKNLPDQALRDMRNCLIVRDAVRVVSDIQDWYARWEE